MVPNATTGDNPELETTPPRTMQQHGLRQSATHEPNGLTAEYFPTTSTFLPPQLFIKPQSILRPTVFMNQTTEPLSPPAQSDTDAASPKPQWTGMCLLAIAALATGVFYYLRSTSPNPILIYELGYGLSAAVCLSVALWQACDPFAEAAQWFGIYWRIPSSVRGATLDAVASSMPELFTGLFFVLVAVWGDKTLAERIQHSTDGYGSTIATCAGSAIYNLILIPALCCLTLVYTSKSHNELKIETEVLRRDGNWVLFTQFGLLLILFSPRLHWWMALAGLLSYLGYIVHLAIATGRHRQQLGTQPSSIKNTQDPSQGQGDLPIRWTPVVSINEAADRDGEDEEERVYFLFNLGSVRLNSVTSIIVLLLSTIAAASACYFLVEITNALSVAIQIPAFFVSVILVASVSSVPDTLLSIGAARRGDDSGAISNVFGSNIFDICIGMSIPLLVCCYLNNWEPINLVGDNAETMRGVTGLRILLFAMTSIAMFMFWRMKKVTATMSWFFCLMYLIFILYAVAGGLGWISV